MGPRDTEIFGSSDKHKIWGVQFAIIEGNDDPLGRGRVQISLPWLGSTMWAVAAYPPGSAPSSRYQSGDEVVVAFAAGDVSHPVVLGRVGT